MRYTVLKHGKNKYIFDKLIFRMGLGMMIFLFLLSFLIVGDFKEKVFVSCPKNIGKLPCENPLYHNEVYRGKVPDYLLNEETVPSGFILNPKPNIINQTPLMFFLIVLWCFFMNDLLSNNLYIMKRIFTRK